MKRTISLISAFMALLMLPLLGLANGVYSPGGVQIVPTFNGGSSMNGFFNVRYNPAVSQGHI